MTSQNTIFGPVGPEPQSRTMTAGQFSCLISDGALRRLSWEGVEVVRKLDCPVRDVNWGTYSQSDIEEEFTSTGPVLHYRRSFKIGGDQLSGIFTVSLDPGGELTANLELKAHRDFQTNRAGFSLLHPINGVAGEPLTVVHSDATEQDSQFPEAISPSQPVFDICALRHQVNGVAVSIEFDGDVFEMEDQRNWTDASYKTYNRPLSLPMPSKISAGESIVQEIRITVTGEAKSPGKPAGTQSQTNQVVRFERSASSPFCPDILLAAEADWIDPVTGTGANFAGAKGLLIRIGAGETGAEPWLAQLAQTARKQSAYCDVEIVVPADVSPDGHLTEVATQLAEANLVPRHVIALPEPYLKSYQPDGDWPGGPSPDDCAAGAGKAFPGATIGAGMLTNFTEFNRCPPSPGTGQYLTFGTSAIVHAADDLSVLETLESLPYIFATLEDSGGKRPTRLGLVSIGMRSNPYGADVAANPDNNRVAMAKNDPRQSGLFAASFAVAASAAAANSGCSALALAAPAGPFAMASSGPDSLQAWPIFHVVQALCRLAGAQLVHLTGAPAGIHANVAKMPDNKIKGLITNATLAPVTLDFDQPVAVKLLDTSAGPNTASVRWESDTPATPVKTLALEPCAIAFISIAMPQ